MADGSCLKECSHVILSQVMTSNHNIQQSALGGLPGCITNMAALDLSSLLSYTGMGPCIYCTTYGNVPVKRGVTCR